MPTTPPTVTPLGIPPSRDDPANFAARGDAFLGSLPAWSDQVQAVGAAAFANAGEAQTAAASATGSSNAAAISAQAAVTAAGAVVWVSGQAYAVGATAWSPITGFVYRRIVAGSSSADPSIDPVHWKLAGSNKLQMVNVSGTSVTASGGAQYVLTNPLQTTVTLPTGLQPGETVGVIVANGRTDNRVNAGALQLVVAGETEMNIGDAEAEFALTYVSPSVGWRLANLSLIGSKADPAAAPESPAVRTVLASYTARSLREMSNGPQVPFPTASPVRQITGQTRYVDPTVVGPGTGTYPDPFKSLATALAASTSGDGVLVEAGTTVGPLTTSLIAPAGVVIGVYNAANGNRISNRPGAATIDCGSIAGDAISAVNKDDVCVDGFRFTNTPTAGYCVNISGTSQRGQIVRCTATGGRYHFAIQSSGTGHVMEFNESTNAADFAVLRLLQADDATSSISHNKIVGPVDRGLMVCDTVNPDPALGGAYGTRRFSGRIQANYITDGGIVSSSAGLLILWVSGGAPTVTHNYGARGHNGIWWTGTGENIADWSGAIIESNDFSFCQFPLVIGKAMGDVKIQFNSFTDAGSKDGVNPVNSDRYSRCIETYGLTYASRVQGMTIRWNYVARAKYHYRAPGDAPGSEAIGIGLDNNTYDFKVYGNFSERNEAQGIQANSGAGNSIYGNWSVDDCCAASVTDWPDDAKAAIAHVNNHDIYIGNNTVIQTGRVGQLHGIAESAGFASTGGQMVNNVVVGALRSAISRNACTERGNLAIRCLNAVTSSVTQSAITADATTLIGVAGDIEMSGVFYQPTAGGNADGSGVAPAVGSVSGSGALLSINTPRGAIHPVKA